VKKILEKKAEIADEFIALLAKKGVPKSIARRLALWWLEPTLRSYGAVLIKEGNIPQLPEPSNKKKKVESVEEMIECATVVIWNKARKMCADNMKKLNEL